MNPFCRKDLRDARLKSSFEHHHRTHAAKLVEVQIRSEEPTQPMHDVTTLAADLRDQLARHDKRIAFLFGAGTSCAVRIPSSDGKAVEPLIPDVAGLTNLCEQSIRSRGAEFADAWERIRSGCKAANQNPNVEDVLTRVRTMIEAVGSDESLAGLSRDELVNFEETMRREIAKVVNPPTVDVLDELPHRQFARWLAKTARQHSVEIFTVNYDILFELALEAERVPVFDGFVGSYEPFFHPDSLRHKEWAPGGNYTRLWKMHGSVTWSKKRIDGRVRVIRGNPDDSGEMILPTFQKYDESRQQPYVAFAERLTRFLELNDSLLIVCGFAFGDQHINNLIFEALDNHPRTHVFALQFAEHASGSDLIRRSHRHHNMVVVGPCTGVIGGKQATWGMPDDQTDLHGMFEAIADPPEPADGSDENQQQMVPAKVNIGDFAEFCRFLGAISST